MFTTLDTPAASRTHSPHLRTAAPFLSLIEDLTDRTHRRLMGFLPDPNQALAALLDRAGATSPLGFKSLTPAQVLRRLNRRMRACSASDMTTYARLAIDQPDELASLRRSLHVRSSRFFHDPEALFVLERYAMLALFAAGTLKTSIRVLVTGCASGEEAYTIAILFHEYARCMAHPPTIKVHAVENDVTLVEAARRGHYPRTIAGDLSEACLAAYFTPEVDGYAVARHVRDSVTIHHGVPQGDAALEELDLIVSRNPVLLMDPVRQDELLRSCHARLRAGGYLLLGSALQADDASAFFESVVGSSGLYRSRDTSSCETLPASLSEVTLSETHQKQRSRGLLAYAKHLKEELFQSEERARMGHEYLDALASPTEAEMAALDRAYRRLEQLVAASNTGFLHIDGDRRIQLFSRGLRQILALDPNDIGRPIADFSWPMRSTLEDMIASAQRAQTATERTLLIADRTYQVRVSPVDDLTESAGSVVCSFVDSTTHARADEWLELQGQAFDQLHDPVIVTNCSLQVLFVNESASRRYGIDHTASAGRGLGTLLQIDWPSQEERQKAYDALVERGSWVGRQVHRTLDGQTYEVETAVSMLRDARREEIGLLISVRELDYRTVVGAEALRRVIDDLSDRSTLLSSDGAPVGAIPLPALRPSRPPRERQAAR